MGLQLSGSINLGGNITLSSGSITVLTGSVTAPNNVYTLTFGDMEINHTSGSESSFAGVGIPFTSSGYGAGLIGGNLFLIPTASANYPTYATYKSLWRNAKVLSYTRSTNITGSDFPDWDFTDATKISLSLVVAYKTAINSYTTGEQVQDIIRSSTPGTYLGEGDFSVISNGATKTDPIQILDAGTLYKSSPPPFEISLSPTEWSPRYFSFFMTIGAAFPTKTYKFRFELEIEDNGLPVV